jgi:hypothetical protein
VHVVCDLVALCFRIRGVGGEVVKVCELGVEADQDLVVVQQPNGVFARCAWWQVRDMVESCCGAECYRCQNLL